MTVLILTIIAGIVAFFSFIGFITTLSADEDAKFTKTVFITSLSLFLCLMVLICNYKVPKKIIPFKPENVLELKIVEIKAIRDRLDLTYQISLQSSQTNTVLEVESDKISIVKGDLALMAEVADPKTWLDRRMTLSKNWVSRFYLYVPDDAAITYVDLYPVGLITIGE